MSVCNIVGRNSNTIAFEEFLNHFRVVQQFSPKLKASNQWHCAYIVLEFRFLEGLSRFGDGARTGWWLGRGAGRGQGLGGLPLQQYIEKHIEKNSPISCTLLVGCLNGLVFNSCLYGVLPFSAKL